MSTLGIQNLIRQYQQKSQLSNFSDYWDIIALARAIEILSPTGTTNTGSGGSSVTINAVSGVATYTDVIIHNEKVDFTLNNSFATTSSIMLVSLKYGGAGYPSLLHYEIPSNGVVKFHLANLKVDGGTPNTDANLNIFFTII